MSCEKYQCSQHLKFRTNSKQEFLSHIRKDKVVIQNKSLQSISTKATHCTNAKYDGACQICKKAINKGDLIYHLKENYKDSRWCINPCCGEKI